ncbi:unnamed protein product [Cuscuta campestris]|uniref:No apical meristem-associated C-terminal domain-containing protein n=1 Tax=Cuscuta campestris TaxID=132261 RepID=A0A484KGX1_9ASTE|nr:unnamed protein product [Cuscuta campestris]
MNHSDSGFFPDNLALVDAAMWYYQELGDRPPMYETQRLGYVDQDSVSETQPEPSGSKKEGCSRSRRSGKNDDYVLWLATTRYQDDGNQGKVSIDLWRILSCSPKWQELNNPDGGSFRKRSTVDAEVEVDDTIGSSDKISPFNVADSDDEDPIPRPIGRKKAKSIASGSGGSASLSASPRDEIGRAMIEQLRAFNLQEQERLKLKEKELKLKEQEAEMKVMQTDPGTLSKFGRMIYEQRMREIKEKYNLP